MDDPRFDFSPTPSFRIGGKQVVYETESKKIEDSNVYDPMTNQLQWVLDPKRPVLFDTMTRFHVECYFQVRTRAAAAEGAAPAAWGEWGLCAAAEYADVMVYPYYLGQIFNDWNFYYYNDHPKIHEESSYAPYHLEAYLYHCMDKDLKRYLCPEPCHPGHVVPTKPQGWSYAENSDWHNESKRIFVGRNISFTWIPLFQFPFYQGTNHMLTENTKPRVVPINHTGKLVVRAKLKDTFDSMFRVRDGVANKQYRFGIKEFSLVLEEVRMNPSIERNLFSTGKKILHYPGVTKIMRAENIANGTFVYTTRFEDVVFPEQIFIYALPKTVVAGTHKFSTATVGSPFFLKHNIVSVLPNFAGYNLSMTDPNFGSIVDDLAEIKSVEDHIKYGPFGMKVNSEIVTRESAVDGFANTDFPHVLLSFVPSKYASLARMVPMLTDPSLFNVPRDLNITLKFDGTIGSANDANYFIYLAYTNENMRYDQKSKKFLSPYGLH